MSYSTQFSSSRAVFPPYFLIDILLQLFFSFFPREKDLSRESQDRRQPREAHCQAPKLRATHRMEHYPNQARDPKGKYTNFERV